MQYERMLYKYKSDENMEYIYDILENNRFYLAKREELNDPLEGASSMDFGFAGSSYYVGTPQMHTQYEDILNEYRVLSLSEENDNVVMWSHYANNYKGVCIETCCNERVKEIKPVHYTRVIQHVSHKSFEDTASKLLFFKAKEWNYECEWRYISKENYLKIKEGEITKIFIGYRTDPDNIRRLIEICMKQKIEIFIAMINPYEYRVEMKSLDEYRKCMKRVDKDWNEF